MKIYSFDEIEKETNCRAPFLLLDSVIEEADGKWKAVKNISFNDVVFSGHFPGHPIYPGVMQVEAMEQFAKFALRNVVAAKNNEIILSKKLRKVKFRKPVFPGDRLFFELDIRKADANGAETAVQVKTNSGLVSQAEITLGIFPEKKQAAPPIPFSSVDKNPEILFDVNKIMTIIPHRYPFLFIDYVVKQEKSHLTAVKNITGTEPFCVGCGLSRKVLPVAFLSEIAAQAGCVLILNKEENKGKLAYFLGIDEAECFEPAGPGDQLRVEIELQEGISKFGKGDGEIFVGEKLVSRTALTFAVVGR